MAKIVIRNLTKTYSGGAVVALQDINLEVDANESLCVLGPSGCGKTTLLRIVDCLIARDRGEVLIDGQLVTQPRPDIAVVFQHFGLFPWKRLEENIAYGLTLRGKSRQEISATVDPFENGRGFSLRVLRAGKPRNKRDVVQSTHCNAKAR